MGALSDDTLGTEGCDDVAEVDEDALEDVDDLRLECEEVVVLDSRWDMGDVGMLRYASWCC